VVVIRSMTGFAAVARETEAVRVNATAKSVNHRFLDVVIKAPQTLSPIESRLRALVQQRLARGRVELMLAVDVTTPPEREVVVDELLLDRVASALASVRARGLIAGTLTASDLLRIPQVLEIRPKALDVPAGASDALVALVEMAVVDALNALIAMRDTEGRYLATDLDARLAIIGGYVDALERESAAGQRQLEARLRDRLAALPAEVTGDPAALAQEIVRFASRSDIDEELVRLRSHFEHWRQLVANTEPCGRKLDFLVQEMNREINTIGSKAEGARATESVVAAKAELERIREQVQNVE
jgi:uncharacterized protein (TIGR00255 family)